MSYDENYATNNERIAYAQGYTYGIWVGAAAGAIGMLLIGVLIGRYVPL